MNDILRVGYKQKRRDDGVTNGHHEDIVDKPSSLIDASIGLDVICDDDGSEDGVDHLGHDWFNGKTCLPIGRGIVLLEYCEMPDNH